MIRLRNVSFLNKSKADKRWTKLLPFGADGRVYLLRLCPFLPFRLHSRARKSSPPSLFFFFLSLSLFFTTGFPSFLLYSATAIETTLTVGIWSNFNQLRDLLSKKSKKNVLISEKKWEKTDTSVCCMVIQLTCGMKRSCGRKCPPANSPAKWGGRRKEKKNERGGKERKKKNECVGCGMRRRHLWRKSAKCGRNCGRISAVKGSIVSLRRKCLRGVDWKLAIVEIQ